jgi:damage-control phosphatase, subfamily I
VRVHPDCFPCFLKQTVFALKLATSDQELQERVIKSVLEDIAAADTSKPPAYATTFIHRKIRRMLGADPFSQIKSEYNKIALGLCTSLKSMMKESNDPLRTAVRLSIAGNVIDFGVFTSVDISGSIRRAVEEDLACDEYKAFSSRLNDVQKVLFLTDNSGEIVFDRLLIERLVAEGKRVEAVVKGAPVINDSTIEDARESGLTEVCEVTENGSDCVGTIPGEITKEVLDKLMAAEMVISKGQANFETLADMDKEIFFLFQSKCEVISRELGVPEGSMLLMKT